MHGDEIRAVPEIPFNLQFSQGVRDAGEDVPSAEKGGAERHEVCDGVVAIADELVQDGGDEGEGFGVVEADAAGEALLGEGAGLVEEEFVYLLKESLSAISTLIWSDGVVEGYGDDGVEVYLLGCQLHGLIRRDLEASIY